MELTNFFYKHGFNTHLLDSDQETIYERISTADSEDLFIFYTKYGDSTRLKNVIKEAKEKKSRVIVNYEKVIKNKQNLKINVTHYLLVDTGLEHGLEANFSKSIPFHYFNDLLMYHYHNKFLKK